jgi:hypothetical protein
LIAKLGAPKTSIKRRKIFADGYGIAAVKAMTPDALAAVKCGNAIKRRYHVTFDSSALFMEHLTSKTKPSRETSNERSGRRARY